MDWKVWWPLILRHQQHTDVHWHVLFVLSWGVHQPLSLNLNWKMPLNLLLSSRCLLTHPWTSVSVCFSTSPYFQHESLVFFFSTCGCLSVCVSNASPTFCITIHLNLTVLNVWLAAVCACLCVCAAIRACRCINHWSRLRLFYYSWCRPFIASDIYLFPISHDLQEKEGGGKSQCVPAFGGGWRL